jgi:hypothetical protein
MNTQTLNRMIKASYSAPNGFQLRKACYSLLALNSRKASAQYMTMEQLAQMPEEVQNEVKTELVKTALIESSESVQANLARYGLKDVKIFIQTQGLNEKDIAQGIKEIDPMLKRAISHEVKSVPQVIKMTSNVITSSNVEEAVSQLPPTMADIIQQKFENINYTKIFMICVAIYYVLYAQGALVDVINEALKTQNISATTQWVIFWTGAVIQTGLVQGVYFVLNYFFGNIFKWINKRIGMILGWAASLIPRSLSALLNAFGSGLSGIKGALGRFFSRQAKIAMQSSEFRRAYYSI